MSTHNICFYKLMKVIQMNTTIYACIKKIRTHITQASLNMPLRKSSARISLTCALIRKIFYYIFFFISSNFENLKHTVW